MPHPMPLVRSGATSECREVPAKKAITNELEAYKKLLSQYDKDGLSDTETDSSTEDEPKNNQMTSTLSHIIHEFTPNGLVGTISFKNPNGIGIPEIWKNRVVRLFSIANRPYEAETIIDHFNNSLVGGLIGLAMLPITDILETYFNPQQERLLKNVLKEVKAIEEILSQAVLNKEIKQQSSIYFSLRIRNDTELKLTSCVISDEALQPICCRGEAERSHNFELSPEYISFIREVDVTTYAVSDVVKQYIRNIIK